MRTSIFLAAVLVSSPALATTLDAGCGAICSIDAAQNVTCDAALIGCTGGAVITVSTTADDTWSVFMSCPTTTGTASGTCGIDATTPVDPLVLNLSGTSMADDIALTGIVGSQVTSSVRSVLSVYGRQGDDLITGAGVSKSTYLEYLEGGRGEDVVLGGNGDDVVRGGPGNDHVDGGSGEDVVGGGLGDDIVLGNGSRDFLFGDDGNDLLVGGLGDDYISGADGDDILCATGGTLQNTTTQGSGLSLLPIIDSTAVPASTVMCGGSSGVADELGGGPGDDEIYGSTGANNICGDTTNAQAVADNVTAQVLAGPLDPDAAPALACFPGGDSGDDYIDGDAGADIICDEADDTDDISGGTGDDQIWATSSATIDCGNDAGDTSSHAGTDCPTIVTTSCPL